MGMSSILKIWRALCYGQFLCLLGIFTYLGLTSSPGKVVPLYNDWLMHFTGYVAAGISISFAFPRWSVLKRFLFLLIFSVLIETGQHFLPPRTFSLMDIVANGGGVLAGIVLFYLLRCCTPGALLPFFGKELPCPAGSE